MLQCRVGIKCIILINLYKFMSFEKENTSFRVHFILNLYSISYDCLKNFLELLFTDCIILHALPTWNVFNTFTVLLSIIFLYNFVIIDPREIPIGIYTIFIYLFNGCLTFSRPLSQSCLHYSYVDTYILF